MSEPSRPSEAPSTIKRKRRNKAAYKDESTKNRRQKRNNVQRYDAFTVKKATPFGGTEIARVDKQEGIHSQAWVNAIKPQPKSGFLCLPLELRNKIYIYALTDNATSPLLNPRKHGRFYRQTYPSINTEHFCSKLCYRALRPWEQFNEIAELPPDSVYHKSCQTIELYHILATLCSQTYLDVIGSGILYKISKFFFTSKYQLKNYVEFINPRFLPLLTHVCLTLPVHQKQISPFDKALFDALVKSLTLKKLEINIIVAWTLCIETFQQINKERIYRSAVRDEVLAKWASGRWEILADSGLQELIIRIRCPTKRVIRDKRSESFVADVRKRIGCGGEDDGPGKLEVYTGNLRFIEKRMIDEDFISLFGY
ncbi:hypothetical protein GLAREA_11705 [Glarea lozoyensis ATCC 20868]|uniref:Uncharacterized protein n=1 Tax=Glarea lozoyensis (strain ATCC 20868 / MF5171) TaxID=1116229 RepID=S3CIN4_GLAL2|nr:uncharacterized protein GLAREA_11705 [Glarea lozoyensis ATCC 20868]EPE25124.1 hypothetical protein GLAREA_11705 [Glarea lozoyensis ATCC 20868]